MKVKSGILALSAGVLAATLVVAAPAGAEVGVTKDTIKIGALGVLTGPLAKFGATIYDGIETVYEEANKAGGIHGRKIVYVREDDQCKAANAIGAVKKLIHQHKVFMIHGGACSNASLAAKPEIVANGVPWVITASTAVSLTEPVSPNIFSTMLAGWMESYAQVQYAMDSGMKRIAIVAQLDNWGRARYDPLIDAFKARGIEPVADEEVSPDPTDATATMLRIQQSKADAVILILFPKAAAVVVRDAYKIGYKPVMIGGSTLGDIAVFDKTVGIPGAVDRLTALSAVGFGADNPKLVGWKKKIEAKYPNSVFNIYHMFGIASGQFVVEALKRAGPNLTRDSINKALEGMSIQTDTYAGPLKCSAASHQCHNTPAWFGLKDGKTVQIGVTTVTK